MTFSIRIWFLSIPVSFTVGAYWMDYGGLIYAWCDPQ